MGLFSRRPPPPPPSGQPGPAWSGRALRFRVAPGIGTTAETVWSFGVHVGERLVRNAGGVWIEGPDAQLLGMPFAVHLGNGTVANPIGRAFRQVHEGPGESLQYFYQVMTASP